MYEENHQGLILGVNQGEMVLNPFTSLLTLQEPKHSFYTNFETNQLD